MPLFFLIADSGTVDLLLVSIPESLGLLAFGIGLVVVAVLIRWLMGRPPEEKDDGKVTKKA